MKRTVPELLSAAEPLVMVTAYDYPGGRHAEGAGAAGKREGHRRGPQAERSEG